MAKVNPEQLEAAQQMIAEMKGEEAPQEEDTPEAQLEVESRHPKSQRHCQRRSGSRRRQ